MQEIDGHPSEKDLEGARLEIADGQSVIAGSQATVRLAVNAVADGMDRTVAKRDVPRGGMCAAPVVVSAESTRVLSWCRTLVSPNIRCVNDIGAEIRIASRVEIVPDRPELIVVGS